jgi:NDP-sugar pyrophosphorylase family protein
MAIQHAVILAAGRGARMMPLTRDLPKAMAPYNGTTLIAQGIERIREQVPAVHVTVGYLKAKLAEHVIQHGAATVLNTEGHGNAWWLFGTFLRLIDEPVLVLTCDNVTELDLALLDAEYTRHDSPACMVIPVTPVPGLDGDYVLLDGDLVVGLSRTDPAATYLSGIQVVNPAKINRLTRPVEEFGEVWSQLMDHGQLRASRVYPKSWTSFDTVDHLDSVHGRRTHRAPRKPGRRAEQG